MDLKADMLVICNRMERKPDGRTRKRWSKDLWWNYWRGEWVPAPLTLDRIRKVEAELTDEQWSNYQLCMDVAIGFQPTCVTLFRAYTHATARQKITALAAVFRSEDQISSVSNSLEPG